MIKVNYEEKGITLIALVITIIILLILAGVTLTTALGQHGLFQRARTTVEKYKESKVDESEKLAELDKFIDNKEKGKIKVKKTLKNLEGIEVQATNSTFYVALFSDNGRTDKVSDVLKMVFSDASSVEVEFTNLEFGNYYVSEVNEKGIPMDNGTDEEGGVFAAVFPDGNDVEITEEKNEGLVEFENVFSEWPTDVDKESIKGKIRVKKTLKTVNGDEMITNGLKFYVALFSDKERKSRVGEVLTLDFINSSSAEAEFVDLGAGTYYVSEVTNDGTPVAEGATVSNGMFTVVFPNGSEVEINKDKTEVLVEFENKFNGGGIVE